MLPQAVSDHYQAQQRLTVATLALTRREWAQMGPDFDASWVTVGRRLRLLVTSAQLGAARNGAAYVPMALTEAGVDADPLGQVVPQAFAGVASDGRDLDGLLYSAVTTAKRAMAIDVTIHGFRSDVSGGASTQEALAAGGKALDMYVQTMVADAGRSAASVAIAARPTVGYVRMLNPPSCSRCAVLAGKFYRWSQGFRRHPRCDCVHVPATENVAGDLRTDPLDAIRAGQVTGLSKADTKAILEDNADVSQVINAHRGMSTAQVFGERLKVTTDGTTRRGIGGARLRANGTGRPVRLMPESIYRIAESREEAVRLLRAHGYIL